jgi:hypothetical protein
MYAFIIHEDTGLNIIPWMKVSNRQNFSEMNYPPNIVNDESINFSKDCN